MSSPATDPANKDPLAKISPAPASAPTIKIPKGGAAPKLIGTLFLIGNVVAWPITFVIGLILALWQLRHQIFPFRSRVGRQQFWIMLGSFYVCAGFLVFGILAGVIEAADWPPAVGYAIFAVVGAGFAFSAVTVAIGRLHDRDISGWWILLYYGIPATAIALYLVMPLAAARGLISSNLSDTFTGIALFVVWPFICWAVFALGCQRGTVGPNRFGREVSWGRVTPPRTQAPRSTAHAAISPTPVSPSTQFQSPANTGAPAPAIDPSSSGVQPAAGVAQPAPTHTPALPGAAAALPSSAITEKRGGRIRSGLENLFSFNGRLDRRRYWICVAIQCVYAVVVWTVISEITTNQNLSPTAYWTLVGALAFLPAGISSVATGAKRCHDHDFSGKWTAGLFLVIVGLIILCAVLFGDSVEWIGSCVAAWITAIWGMGGFAGTVGPNAFGPDPLDRFAATDG
jgi:uncharacterized membrane protein YhaH (DUF805 family)